MTAFYLFLKLLLKTILPSFFLWASTLSKTINNNFQIHFSNSVLPGWTDFSYLLSSDGSWHTKHCTTTFSGFRLKWRQLDNHEHFFVLFCFFFFSHVICQLSEHLSVFNHNVNNLLINQQLHFAADREQSSLWNSVAVLGNELFPFPLLPSCWLLRL